MFEFKTRDLVWGTVVAALVVGWCLDHKHVTQQQGARGAEVARLQEELRKCEKSVEGYEKLVKRMTATQNQLTSYLSSKSKSWTIQELRDAIAAGIKQADSESEKLSSESDKLSNGLQ